MVRRITPEILKQMKTMRQGGATYPQIQERLGITKERCIAYLKDIVPSIPFSAMTVEWQQCEKEAKPILEQMGFTHLIDLNDICNVPPYWDYYAEKEKGKWLVDVTINGQKSIQAKQDRMIDGYNHAILLKTSKEWKFIEIRTEVMTTIQIKSKE